MNDLETEKFRRLILKCGCFILITIWQYVFTKWKCEVYGNMFLVNGKPFINKSHIIHILQIFKLADF